MISSFEFRVSNFGLGNAGSSGFYFLTNVFNRAANEPKQILANRLNCKRIKQCDASKCDRKIDYKVENSKVKPKLK